MGTCWCPTRWDPRAGTTTAPWTRTRPATCGISRWTRGTGSGWSGCAGACATGRIDRLRGDTYEHEWKSQTLTAQNPIFASGLGQMTLGAPFPCFNGGLLMARVRYFDPERHRPGLPPDVAALVERLEAERTVVHLVNTSALNSRRVILQGGAYQEHLITQAQGEGGRAEVNGGHFAVELLPTASIRLEIGTRCFVRRPTYAFSWQG